MMARELPPAPFPYLHPLADLDAVDVEHTLERVRIGRIEEADYIDVILELVSSASMRARNVRARLAPQTRLSSSSSSSGP
jgi:hypothetical protein